MNASPVELERGNPLRPVWIAVAWAEAGLVVSATLAIVAFVRELDCLFFCTQEENETGAGFGALLAAAVAVLVGAFVLAARASGWRGRRAAGRAIAAVVVLALLLVALSSLPVVATVGVIAIGLGGIIAIKSPAERALRPRLLAVLALAVLGVGASAFAGGFGELVLVLGALPALAVADSVALRRVGGPER